MHHQRSESTSCNQFPRNTSDDNVELHLDEAPDLFSQFNHFHVQFTIKLAAGRMA